MFQTIFPWTSAKMAVHLVSTSVQTLMSVFFSSMSLTQNDCNVDNLARFLPVLTQFSVHVQLCIEMATCEPMA